MSAAGMLASLLEEEAVGGGQTGGAVGVPGDYGANLIEFLDAEVGVALSTLDVISWIGASGRIYDPPGGQRAPLFLAATQNALPGVSFLEDIGTTGSLRRKLFDQGNQFDNFFSGSGRKSLAFAARLDDIANSFGTAGVIASKGFEDTNGWRLRVTTSGTLEFAHRRSNGSVWQISASGFYNEGDLVLGYINYDGGNTSNSGFFRLYNQTQFVTTGSISVGSASGVGLDATSDLLIGNLLDNANDNSNAPFGGPIFGFWMTKPGVNTFDESYMSRWIP